MNNERFEALSTAYREGLAEAVAAKPDGYALGVRGNPSEPADYARHVADKMLAKVRVDGIRSVGVTGADGWKRACKKLNIKHTYTAIENYLDGN